MFAIITREWVVLEHKPAACHLPHPGYPDIHICTMELGRVQRESREHCVTVRLKLERAGIALGTTDDIRCLTVHPTVTTVTNIVLTGSDDMTVKAWDWGRDGKRFRLVHHSVTRLSSHRVDRSMKAISTSS